jgi:hypothetical protein
MLLNTPVSTRDDVFESLKDRGFCLIEPSSFAQLIPLSLDDLRSFNAYWNALSVDRFLSDHGKYRLRRHSSYVVKGAEVELCPHRPHWQPVDYNALHGGMLRHFEPLDERLNKDLRWHQLIGGISSLFTPTAQVSPWFTEAHQFRITTAGGIGRPTPEGAHRDGVDFIAIVLIERHRIKGGETRLFKIHGQEGVRFTLNEPWSVLLIDDHRIIHETTPIQDADQSGYRDTLVLTYRQGGFQDPA